MKRLIVALLISSLTQTVALGQKKSPVRLCSHHQSTGRRQPGSATRAADLADTKWFELFKDAQLQELIRLALANN